MADQDRTGRVRPPGPWEAAQDPHNVAQQEHVRRDTDANRAEATRVDASTPSDVRHRTVGEILGDAERNAGRR